MSEMRMLEKVERYQLSKMVFDNEYFMLLKEKQQKRINGGHRSIAGLVLLALKRSIPWLPPSPPLEILRGQRGDFSTVNGKAERNAVDAQAAGLSVWERPCKHALVCVFNT